MIAIDEESLICDFAETYRIFDYRSLPVRLVATLAVGLRANSRIKMKISGLNVTIETLLMANMVDKIAWLVWSKTVDGQNGVNMPESLVNKLLGKNVNDTDIEAFVSGQDYEDYRRKLLKEGEASG